MGESKGWHRMSSWYPWVHTPMRMFFAIILVQHWGYELKRHAIYPSKSFGAREKTAIKKAIYGLPESPNQLLALSILEVLGPPPKDLIIKSFVLQPKREKYSSSNRIMLDTECYNAITGLAIMGMDSRSIKREFADMLLGPNYSLEQIDRFRYQFWNVKPEEGWDHKSQESLRKLILSDPDLTQSFQHLLSGALSDKRRRDIALHYKIMLSPADRTREYQRASDNALLIQNKKIESNDLHGANEAANLLSKTINSGAKIGIIPATTPPKKNNNLLNE